MSEPANEPDGDGGERAPADWPHEGRVRVDGIGDLTAVGTGGGDGKDASDGTDGTDAIAGRVDDPTGASAATIVSVSDVHGYLAAARSALTAVGETDRFDPVVETDDDGRLHWAGNDHVLVVNGDLIDRGPDNAAAVAAVDRLAGEAPPGRVRYHVGNHEMALLLPAVLHWPGTYSGEVGDDVRRAFYGRIRSGLLAAAFEGYRYTYSHAGQPEAFDVAAANRDLRRAADRLLAALDGAEDGGDGGAGQNLPEADADREFEAVQEAVAAEYDLLFGTDGWSGRGADAGLTWMDFAYMPETAPSQVVGHSRQPRPTRTGEVVCGNVIRSTRGSPGGEAVLVETPDELVAVRRDDRGEATVVSV